MLQAIRDRATGWIAYGIVGFLIIPFAFWGIDQYRGGGEVDVAEVDGSEITLQEFQLAFQRQQNRLRAMFGGDLPPELIDETRLKNDVIRQLVNERLLAKTAVDEGYRISDEQLAREINQMAVFQSDGRFDSERYQLALSRQGLTPTGFEDRLRQDLAIRQMELGVVESFTPTEDEVQAILALRNQRREIGYSVLSFEEKLQQTSVTDDEIEAWFDENKEGFRAPEKARFAFVELDVDDLAETVTVDEAAVETLYTERKDRYQRPEERSASHILVTVPSDASEEAVESAHTRVQEMYEQLNSGALTFQEAMERANEDPESAMEAGELGVIAPGMMDDSVTEALYALTEAGDVSEPVRSEFGFHLLRLDDVRPGESQPLEEVRAELEQEYRREKADAMFFEMADQAANLAYETPGSLDPVSEALGLEIQESDWITRDGGEGIGAYPAVVEALFASEVLDDGVNSEPVEVSPTHMVVARLLEHEPARLRTLEEVNDEVQQSLREERARHEIRVDAESLLSKAQAGADLESLAEEAGATWQSPALASRTETGLDQAILGSAFKLPKPGDGAASFGLAALGNGDQAVVGVYAVEQGDADDADAGDAEVDAADPDTEDETGIVAQELKRLYGTSEFQSLVNALQARKDVKIFSDRL